MVSRSQWIMIVAGIAIAVVLVVANSPKSFTRAVLSGQCDKRPKPEQCRGGRVGWESVGWGGTSRPLPVTPEPKH